HPSSPHYGNVYVVWGAREPMKFARSTDHGATWKGVGAQSPGSQLVPLSYAPDHSVSADGTLHIFWHNEGGSTIDYIRSTDGGNTVEQQRTIGSGMSTLAPGCRSQTSGPTSTTASSA